MLQEISSKFISLFEKNPEVKVQAPGRINLI